MRYWAILFLFISILLIAPTGCGESGLISGHIYQSDGTPVNAEAIVYCVPLFPYSGVNTPGDPALPYAMAKGFGEYKFNSLPPGSYMILARTTKSDLFMEDSITVNVKKGHSTSQDIYLVPGGTITGRITGIEPWMLQTAPFEIQCHTKEKEGLSYWGGSCIVAEDGTYLLENVAPGDVRIDVYNGRAPGSYHAQGEMVTVKSGEQIRKDFSIIR